MHAEEKLHLHLHRQKRVLPYIPIESKCFDDHLNASIGAMPHTGQAENKQMGEERERENLACVYIEQ